MLTLEYIVVESTVLMSHTHTNTHLCIYLIEYLCLHYFDFLKFHESGRLGKAIQNMMRFIFNQWNDINSPAVRVAFSVDFEWKFLQTLLETDTKTLMTREV